jgi:hypothetical protein
MIAVFEQKKLFSYRKHTLYEDKVTVEMKSAKDRAKYEVDIYKVGGKLHYHADNTTPGKVMFLILLLLPIALHVIMLVQKNLDTRTLLLTYACCYLLNLLGLLKENADDIYLTGGEKNLVFFRNKPSEEEVLKFIDLVIKTRKEKIKKDNLFFDRNTSEEEYYYRLLWLRDEGILNQEEYEVAKIDFEIKRLL